MTDSHTFTCPACGWSGPAEAVADDGPEHPFCCPHCGAEELLQDNDE